jgi:hypothetical protein
MDRGRDVVRIVIPAKGRRTLQDRDAPPRPPRGMDLVRIVIPAKGRRDTPRQGRASETASRDGFVRIVIPAKAGIHVATVKVKMGPRFRGDDAGATGTTPVLRGRRRCYGDDASTVTQSQSFTLAVIHSSGHSLYRSFTPPWRQRRSRPWPTFPFRPR